MYALTILFQSIVTFGAAEGCRPFSDLLEDDGSAFNENIEISPKTDISVLPFSSGTTGLPKGVMLSHYNLVANIQQIRYTITVLSLTWHINNTILSYRLRIIFIIFFFTYFLFSSSSPNFGEWTTDDVFMGLLPFFHIYGMTVVLLLGLKQGIKIISLPKFQPESFLTAAQDYKVKDPISYLQLFS